MSIEKKFDKSKIVRYTFGGEMRVGKVMTSHLTVAAKLWFDTIQFEHYNTQYYGLQWLYIKIGIFPKEQCSIFLDIKMNL